MSLTRLPVLLEDASRLDWTRARYMAAVDVRQAKATVKHGIDSAPELEAALDGGDAEWVTELRCPRTLLSRQMRSRGSEQAIDLAADDIIGDAFLIPGLVAIDDFELPTSGLDPLVWHPDEMIHVPAGWWLARGDALTTTPLTASLVRFRRDPDGVLNTGQMSVEEDSDGGRPFFRVTLAEGLYDNRRTNRDVQIAGLIGACSLLPRSSLRADGDNASDPIAQQLRARFEDAEIPDWTSEHFDPALAATVLEAFHELVDEADE